MAERVGGGQVQALPRIAVSFSGGRCGVGQVQALPRIAVPFL